jgi:tellurite resistance protein TerC
MSTFAEWTTFNVFILFLLALDLGLFTRTAHVIHVREAMIRSAIWVALAFVFAGFVYLRQGKDTALQFVAGYVIEESLSVDNLFVMLIIFSYFQVPRDLQPKVLFWGIIGALVFRAVFIILGVSLINAFHFAIYVFGAILIYTAVKLLVSEEEYDPGKNLFLRFSRRFLPVTPEYVRDLFFTRIDGRLFMTPLWIVLWVVNTADIVFAVDSVPAVLSVSRDSFIVYSSNAFAVLGLRSLYFALAGMLDAFHYLRYGLAAILAFVGVKMLIGAYFEYEIPIGIALGVVGGCLAASIIASLVFKKPQPEEPTETFDVGEPRVESTR